MMTLIRRMAFLALQASAVWLSFVYSEDHISAALWFLAGGMWMLVIVVDEMFTALRRGFVTHTKVLHFADGKITNPNEKEVKREA